MPGPTPLFAGRVENGKIQLENVEGWKALLQRNEGYDVDLRLTRHREQRSTQQNRYYWGVVVALLAEHCGYEAEEMHEALKMRFLKIHDDVTGEFSTEKWTITLPTVRSTSTLSTAEFTEYIEQCRRLAAEMGVNVPDPGMME